MHVCEPYHYTCLPPTPLVWLIASLANELAAEKDVCFLCLPHLRGFYQRLGFVQNGMIQQYTTDWNTK